MRRLIAGLLAAALILLPALALADDWMADKLRGPVVQYIDGQWQPLTRGMVVPDSRIVRTLATGHVTFTRGEETVELGPNTQIQIFDKVGKKPFTTVKQYFGTVAVEAQVENVQHFGVDTPFLAAVVKGTRFTVTTKKTWSSVSVRRGHVAVENLSTHSHVLLSVGQMATVDASKNDGETRVSGSGKLPPLTDAKGKPLLSVGASDGNLNVNAAAGLVNLSAGSSGVSAGVGNLASVSVGSGSSGGSGQIVNLNLGPLHLGL